MFGRRTVLIGGAAAALLGPHQVFSEEERSKMYGLIGKFSSLPGKRAELIDAILGSGTMPGCLIFTVSEDVKDPDAIWIHEVWTDKAAHDASLDLPEVKASIARGRPLIAGFEPGAELNVVGGIGLKSA